MNKNIPFGIKVIGVVDVLFGLCFGLYFLFCLIWNFTFGDFELLSPRNILPILIMLIIAISVLMTGLKTLKFVTTKKVRMANLRIALYLIILFLF